MSKKDHWQLVYETKPSETVSWHQDRPAVSLEFIEGLELPKGAKIVDVGSGASRLVDHLLDQEFFNITLVDLATSALDVTRQRLGDKANTVQFMACDVTSLRLTHQVDFWHDRAALHFLTDSDSQQKYRDVLVSCLNVRGHALIATFSKGGPEKCSGLPVQQHNANSILNLLGSGFELIAEREEIHQTPWASEQAFTYFLLKKQG